MSKYVRTEDGILTVDDFVLCLLKKDAGSYGKEILNFEKTERLVDKYSTRNFYEFDIHTLEIGRASRHCIMLECDALKKVEEWPNRKADAIEELCDAYVVEWSKGMNPTKVRGYYPDISKDCLSALLETGEWLNVYAAIWVGKDLISVAKMNGKREFELL